MKTKTPEFTTHFSANNPFTGTWYSVRFADGKVGMIIDRHNGTFQAKPTFIEDADKLFLDVDSAANSIYAELVRTNKRTCFE